MLSSGQGGPFGHLEFLVCKAVQARPLHIGDEPCQCLSPGGRSGLSAGIELFGHPQKHALADIGPLVRRRTLTNALFYASVDHPHPEPFEQLAPHISRGFRGCAWTQGQRFDTGRGQLWVGHNEGEDGVVGLDASALIGVRRLGWHPGRNIFRNGLHHGLRRGIADRQDGHLLGTVPGGVIGHEIVTLQACNGLC